MKRGPSWLQAEVLRLADTLAPALHLAWGGKDGDKDRLLVSLPHGRRNPVLAKMILGRVRDRIGDRLECHLIYVGTDSYVLVVRDRTDGLDC